MAQVKLTGHRDKVWSVQFSQDGKTLASASEDRTVRLWDTASGREAGVLEGHAAGVNAAAFARGGTYLATAGEDGLVKLWNWPERRECALQEHKGGVNALAFSGDARYLLSAGGCRVRGEIRVWDLAGRRPVATLSCPHEIVSLAMAPGGRRFVAGDVNGVLRFWNLSSSSARDTWEAHFGAVRTVRFHPNGHTFISAGDDGKVRFWQTEDCLEIARLRAAGVLAADFSPDGKRLAVGCFDGQVKGRSVAREHMWESLGQHNQPVFSVAYSPDGKHIAAGSVDGDIVFWNVSAQKRQLPARQAPHGRLFPRLAERPFVAQRSENHLCLRLR